MKQPVCVVIGVGPGNGVAVGQKFANEGYSVALCARNRDRMDRLVQLRPYSYAYHYDVTDPDAAESIFAAIETDLGPPETVIYNAGLGI